jgi:hypothetical protein
LDAAGELNALFNHRVYTAAQRRCMLHLLKEFGLLPWSNGISDSFYSMY